MWRKKTPDGVIVPGRDSTVRVVPQAEDSKPVVSEGPPPRSNDPFSPDNPKNKKPT